LIQEDSSKRSSKGGRPQKKEKRDQQLAVMCTREEREQIEQKAKNNNCPVSVWLRTVALQGQTGSLKKTIPKEILLFTATLNHIAANINQLTKKHNQYQLFSAAEITQLHDLITALKQLAADIKKGLP
jgi:undecaprenyl pyrophosphate synthase